MVPPLKRARMRVPGIQLAPEVFQAELNAWIADGTVPDNELLAAILRNNLDGAVGNGSTNAHWGLIRATVFWLWNHAPVECWGSDVNVRLWRQEGGQ